MSLLRAFEHVWALLTGDIGYPNLIPDNDKKDKGFVDEQLDYPILNYMFQRSELAINSLVDEGPKTYYDQMTTAEAKFALSAGLYGADDWGNVSSTANNMYGLAGTKAYVDLCVAFNAQTHDPMLLVLDNTNKTIDVFDPRAGTLTTTSSVLTADLPSPTGTWHVYSMCTDGTSVYVFCTDTHGGADTHRVQAWDIATWDVKSGWAATGTALSGSGTRTVTDGKDIIIANATHLAVAENWTVSVGATPATKCIELLSLSAGAITSFGQGDLGSGSYYVKTLASDGTNLFFIADDSTNVLLGTATIADLTAGTGGTGYPLSLGTDLDTKIVSCGLAIVTASGTTGTAATDIVLRLHIANDATLDTIERGQNSATSINTGDKWIFQNCTDLTYDGINLWITARINNASSDTIGLAKVDIAKLWQDGTDEVKQINDITNSVFATPAQLNSYNNTIFDGRDVWFIANKNASGTLSGYVYRLPLAAWRS